MKKIVLLCDKFNDMFITNDLLATKMKETLVKEAIECEIFVTSIYDIHKQPLDADVILLTPLICFKQFLIEKMVNCPVDKIGMSAYANMDVQYVLDVAFSKMTENYIS